MQVQYWGQEDPLEEEMAAHSNILAWQILRTEEPGGLQSTGSQKVGHDLATQHTQKNHHPSSYHSDLSLHLVKSIISVYGLASVVHEIPSCLVDLLYFSSQKDHELTVMQLCSHTGIQALNKAVLSCIKFEQSYLFNPSAISSCAKWAQDLQGGDKIRLNELVHVKVCRTMAGTWCIARKC